MDSVTSDNMVSTDPGQDRWPVGVKSALVGLSVFLLTVLLVSLRRPRNLPPGPQGWPVVGCVPQIAWAVLVDKQAPHDFLSKLAERYGDVMSLSLAGKLIVVINKRATMREAFGQYQLSSRPEFKVAKEEFPGRGVFAASGTMWLELRRFSLAVLRGLGVGKSSFEGNISTEAKYLTDWLREEQGAPFDPRHPLDNALSNVICAVVFGKRFEYSDDVFKNLLKYTSTVMKESGPGLFAEILPAAFTHFFSFARNYANAMENFYSHIGALIKEHEEVCNPEEPRDFIDEFVKACRAREKQGVVSVGLTPVNLLRTVGDLFIAGTETSATTLRWSLLFMMAYPEVQARIQQELDAVTGRNRLPVLADKYQAHLPYTEATISEIQRMTTILPLSGPHCCTENTTINGYNIPKGTFVLANLWHCHFDLSVWAEPREFRPERFLDDDGKFLHREELIPFGNGRRVCLGENLARMELFIFFTHLLHHFTFKKPADAPSISFKGNLGITWAPADYTVCAVVRD